MPIGTWFLMFLRILELGAKAIRGPPEAVALLAVGVVADRLDHQRLVGAAKPAGEPVGGGERARAVDPRIGGALGVGHPGVVAARRKPGTTGRMATTSATMARQLKPEL